MPVIQNPEPLLNSKGPVNLCGEGAANAWARRMSICSCSLNADILSDFGWDFVWRDRIGYG
jgi:hypothetical protein